MIQKAIKKPVKIEFMTFDGTLRSALEIKQWVNSTSSFCQAFVAGFDGRPETQAFLSIQMPEGLMDANRGDKIIKGVAGEFYPCKPDIFEKSYNICEELLNEETP